MKKATHIETIRGFAILLLVVGHVIGDTTDKAMKVGEDTFWRQIIYNVDIFVMPMFTLAAGWVYALRPFTSSQSFWRFAGKKAQRTLIPMIAVASVYFLLKVFMGGEDGEQLSQIWTLLIFPYNIYWFLPSLFWIFIVVALLEKYHCLDKPLPLFAFLASFVLLFKYQNLIIPQSFPNYFSYGGTLYLMPFFILGIAIQRFKDILSDKRFVTGIWCVFILCLAMIQIIWFKFGNDGYMAYGKSSWLGIITGLSTAALLLIRINVPFLIKIGGFSYTVYLFHSFAKGMSQSTLLKLGINNEFVVFICGVTAGILGPIFIDIILSKWRMTRYIFLGKK